MEDRIPTHGLRIHSIKDGVDRLLRVVRFPDDSTGIRFETIWEEGQKPIVTELVLSPKGIEMLLQGLREINQNPNCWVSVQPPSVISESDS